MPIPAERGEIPLSSPPVPPLAHVTPPSSCAQPGSLPMFVLRSFPPNLLSGAASMIYSRTVLFNLEERAPKGAFTLYSVHNRIGAASVFTPVSVGRSDYATTLPPIVLLPRVRV